MNTIPNRASFEQHRAYPLRQQHASYHTRGKPSDVAGSHPANLGSTSTRTHLPNVLPADSAEPPGTKTSDNFEVFTPNPLSSPSAPTYPPFPTPTDDSAVTQAGNSQPVQVDAGFQGTIVLGGDSFLLLKELVDFREKDIKRRIHLKNGVRDLEYQWQHAAKAQDSFMVTCATLMSAVSNQTMDSAQVQSMQEAWKQLQNLSGHIRCREMDLAKSLDDVFHLENRLYMKEHKFYQRLQGISGSGMLSDEDVEEWRFETDDFTALPPPSSNSSTSSRSIAHKYYSRVGDINLLRERIFNLDSEHRRQKAIRQAQRNNGIKLQPPDKAFYRKFLDEKESMIKEYVFTKEKMEELRDECARLGVEVQPPNLPPFLDHSFRADRSIQNDSGNEAEEEDKLDKYNAYRNAKTQHLATRWIRDVQSSKPVELPECDTFLSLPETTPPRRLGWAEQQKENFIPFPLHAYTGPLTFDRTTGTVIATPKDPRTMGPHRFPGEVPSRRYSAPAPVTFDICGNLNDGILDFLNEDYLNLSAKSRE